VIEVDRAGKIRLSRRELLKEAAEKAEGVAGSGGEDRQQGGRKPSER
jgi:hypothetical protein